MRASFWYSNAAPASFQVLESGPARVSLAVVENSDCRPVCFKVLEARGNEAELLNGKTFHENQVLVPGLDTAEHNGLTSGTGPDGRPAAGSGVGPPFAPGEVLLTRVSVAGETRGLLIVESPEPMAEAIPAAIRALATQVSLALSHGIPSAAMRGATPKHVARSKTPAERLRIRSHNPRANAAAFFHGPASTYQTTAFDATPSRVSSLSR